LPEPVRQFALGAVIGTLAVLTVSFGLIAIFLGFALILALAVVLRSPWLLAGSFVTTGSIWTLLTLRSWDICDRTADFCGRANFVPFLVAAALLVSVGLLTGLLAWWMRRRRASVDP